MKGFQLNRLRYLHRGKLAVATESPKKTEAKFCEICTEENYRWRPNPRRKQRREQERNSDRRKRPVVTESSKKTETLIEIDPRTWRSHPGRRREMKKERILIKIVIEIDPGARRSHSGRRRETKKERILIKIVIKIDPGPRRSHSGRR